jgi:(p)ppGpp synthase/HD superfamily hydrolase
MATPPRIEAAAESSALVREALGAARQAHAGQIRNDSGGSPYIEHPLAVAELLLEHGCGEEVVAAALLHDVVEESELEVGDVRERFGAAVADLVEALTDDETIEPYRRRKDLHRSEVEAAGPDALVIYAADKLTNIDALRRAYATVGAVGGELRAPLDVKVAVWEDDLEMLRRALPDLPFLKELADELAGLGAERAGAGMPAA